MEVFDASCLLLLFSCYCSLALQIAKIYFDSWHIIKILFFFLSQIKQICGRKVTKIMSGFLPFHWISSVYFPFRFTDYYYRYPEYQYTTPRNYYDYTGGLTEEEQLERAVLNSLNERGKASIVFHISNYDSYWGGRNTGKMYCSWFISSLLTSIQKWTKVFW